MQKLYDTVLNEQGQPVQGATVSVYDTGTSTLATLYEDDEITGKANPLTADAYGLVQCMVDDGIYDLVVAYGAESKRINKIAVGVAVPDGSLTLAKFEAMSADVLFGTDAGGDAIEVTLGSGLELDTGVLSATALGAPVSNGGYRSGNYCFGHFGPYGGGSFTVTADRMYALPFMVNASTTFDRIALEVQTGHASNARLGIYNLVDGVPTTLVADCGTVSVASTGLKEVTISETLPPGMYALVAVFSGTPAVLEVDATDTYANLILGWHKLVHGVTAVNATDCGWYASHTYGALPSTFGTPTFTSLTVQMYMRAA